VRPNEREVAGLTCSAVMAALSEVVDGGLSQELRAQIEAHVAGCTWCQQFGDNFAQLLEAMRRKMAVPKPVPDGVLDRLRGALKQP
jgi:predicted anti-sigma-YlaC factor YlaD